jgi:hypothetical protein
MGHHVGTLYKALATEAAGVLFDFEVDLFVAVLTPNRWEFFSTHRAWNAVVSLVGFEMARQVSFPKFFVADVTFCVLKSGKKF